MANFFYDEQIRRFLLQFARMFSNFEVEGAFDDNTGLPVITRVPIRYGDSSRQAATILQENSRNSIPCAPLLTFYITNLKYDRKRVQEPYFVDRKYVRQREWDEDAQTYEQTQGNAFNVERVMPVPYELELTLDIWTTNTNMKLQLLEQILTLFNPSLEIQSTDNYLDWTSLSAVEIDNVNWTSRSIPNNDDSIDIATLKFRLPIWISPPARVTKGGVIHKVIASIYDETGQYVDAIVDDDILLGTRLKVTPHGYQVFLLGNQLRVIPYNEVGDDGNIQSVPDPEDTSLSWEGVISEYGVLREGITQIRLESEVEGEPDIIGTVSPHPADSNILLFDVDPDTLPSNTESPVDAVINPLNSGPDAGLPTPVAGQRYLLVDDIGAVDAADIATAWQGLANEICPGKKNDIIEYDGQKWCVSFNSDDHDAGHGNDPDGIDEDNPAYVANLTTGVQYKYSNGQWRRSYEGIYPGGRWGIVL